MWAIALAHVIKNNLHVISPSPTWVPGPQTWWCLCLLTHLAGPITSVLTPCNQFTFSSLSRLISKVTYNSHLKPRRRLSFAPVPAGLVYHG